MTTANFSDWNGNMFDIGPIYPLVGWEVPMVIVGIIFWVGWHYLQMRMENRGLDSEANTLRQGDNLLKAQQAEHSPDRM